MSKCLHHLIYAFKSIKTKHKKENKTQVKQKEVTLSVRYLRNKKGFIKTFTKPSLKECVYHSILFAEAHSVKIDDMTIVTQD